jgi:hypothetical protein
LLSVVPLSLSILAAPDCLAEPFGGIEFPLGARSFADAVVSYDVHDATGVDPPNDDPQSALGAPDYGQNGEEGYVSLGNAPETGTTSELILRFDDNALVDVPGDDLYIFEIGTSVEATIVAVSPDGKTWYDLGRIEGATRGIDLAAFPGVPKVQMRYVRLNDFLDGETSEAPFGGPDIDAVGAIGSVAASPVEAGAGDAAAGNGSDAAADSGGGDAAAGSGGAQGGGSGGATGTGAGGEPDSGATAGSGGRSGSSSGTQDGSCGDPVEKEVTRCECSSPGRSSASGFRGVASAMTALLLLRGRRRAVTARTCASSVPDRRYRATT